MRACDVLAVTLLLALVAGCSSSPIDPPAPVVPIAQRDRCGGLSADLALIDVVDDPTPFREVPPRFEADEWWVGIDVTVTAQRVLPATASVSPFANAPPSGTFRVHLFTDIDRRVRSGNFVARDASMIVRGRRLLVAFPRNLSTEVDWPFEVIPTDPAADTLSAGWYQFPAGTPSAGVFEPSEWSNPARACSTPPAGG